jgi:hypothetical protein
VHGWLLLYGRLCSESRSSWSVLFALVAGKLLMDELAALATRGAGAGKHVGAEWAASSHGDELLRALQRVEKDDTKRGGGGMQTKVAGGQGATEKGGVRRPRAKKLRVDVEMAHEDQEALDALRLLSSGYGTHSPKYEEEEEDAGPEGQGGEGNGGTVEMGSERHVLGAGGSKEGLGAIAVGGGGQQAGLSLAAAALTPIDLLAMASSGTGLMTPLKGSGLSGAGDLGSAQDQIADSLDSETAAAIQQWGLAMAQMHSLTASAQATMDPPGDMVKRVLPQQADSEPDASVAAGVAAGGGQDGGKGGGVSEPTISPHPALLPMANMDMGLPAGTSLDDRSGGGAAAATMSLLAALGAAGSPGGGLAQNDLPAAYCMGAGLGAFNSFNLAQLINFAALSSMQDGLTATVAGAGRGEACEGRTGGVV